MWNNYIDSLHPGMTQAQNMMGSDLRLNTLRPKQNGRHLPDDIFKCIFLNESIWIWINISLKFVPRCPIDNIPALVQIMAWRWPGDKPLSEPMMVRLPTHICVTRPQWVKIPPITHWGRDKFAAISQTTFSNAFTWMKMYAFHLRFHWSLFLRFELTIFQLWFR